MATAVNSLVLQLFHSFSFTANLANNSKMSRLGFLSFAQEKFKKFLTEYFSGLCPIFFTKLDSMFAFEWKVLQL